MADFSIKYQKAVSEIRQKISNPEELKFVEEKIADISMLFMDVIDRISQANEERLSEIEEKQEQVENKLNKIGNSVKEILSDIYDEEDYDFEIVCPYCNHSFLADIDSELNTKEIKCPECHNIIELDWNDEDEEECSGSCSSCGHDCESNILQYPHMDKNLDDEYKIEETYIDDDDEYDEEDKDVGKTSIDDNDENIDDDDM